MVELLTEEQTKALEIKLRVMVDTLKNELSDNEEAANPVKLDQQLMGRVSRIDAIQQQNMASANRASQEVLLRNTLTALRLIKEGDYGYCQQCDEPIAFKRLDVLVPT